LSYLFPYDFSEFFLSGLWLLVTGWLIVRSGYFAPVSGYIALIGGIGLILLFIGTVTGTEALILLTQADEPSSLLIGRLPSLLRKIFPATEDLSPLRTHEK
jgi:hypothetical protein